MLNNNRTLIILVMLFFFLLSMMAQEEANLQKNGKRIEYGLSGDISTKLLNKGQLKATRINLDVYYPILDVKLLGKASAGLVDIQPEKRDDGISDYFFGIKAGAGYDFLKRTNYSLGIEGLVGYSLGMKSKDEDFDFFEWDISIRLTQKNIFTAIGVNRIYLIEPKFNQPSIFLRVGSTF